MTLLQFNSLPPATIFMVYFVQGSLFLIYLVLGIKILLRNRTRTSLMLSGFYLCSALGFSLNFIFVVLTDLLLYRILYLGTLYFLFVGSMLLSLFTLILHKTENIFTPKVQVVLILSYCIMLFIVFFITNIGTDLEATVYTPSFTITLIVIFSLFTAIPVTVFSLKIYQSFSNPILKRRWRLFMIGTLEQVVFAFGTLIHNFLNEGRSSILWGIVSFILIITSSILIYHGVMRPL